MAIKKRQGPSFRPNLKLSHVVYPGPEQRDYLALRRVLANKVAGGRLIELSDDQRRQRSQGGEG